MAGRYLLTDDAVRDLGDIEDYVATYADESFVEELEDRFFGAFERLLSESLTHPVYDLDGVEHMLHEYRSVNIYHYKAFYYLRDDGDTVVIYRIRHLASDFTRIRWE